MLSLVVARSAARNAFSKPLLNGSTVLPLVQHRSLAAAAAGKATPAKVTAAKKPAAKITAAKPATTKAATGTKKPTATTATKKAAPKKTTITKTATTKTTAKKTTGAAKEPVKRIRGLTPEERKIANQKDLIKELRQKALDPPSHPQQVNPWTQFVAKKLKGQTGKGGLATFWKEHGAQWKAEYEAMTDAQREAIAQDIRKQNEEGGAVFRNWVQQHTPAQIHEANQARARLRKIRANTDPVPRGLKSAQLREIDDDRYPKRARTSLILYVLERLKDYHGDPGMDKMKYVMELGKGFKELSQAEKDRYKGLAAQDVQRYYNELKSIGIEPPKPRDAKL